MSKSVLISIQPYWVFLIIARKMGWNIDKEKTIEVRKSFPKDKDWNRNVEIYCSKDKESFGKIPKEYQPLMAKFLGKVIGEFVCDRIYTAIPDYQPPMAKFFNYDFYDDNGECLEDCLTSEQLARYGDGAPLYGWHISALKTYDKPKELSEFTPICKYKVERCEVCVFNEEAFGGCCRTFTRPPQSWCYLEELQG